MPFVSPETTLLSVVEVAERSFQFDPSSVVYSHLLSAPLPPVTDEVSSSLPLPTLAATPGLAGFAGLVRNGDAAASSVVQPLLLYAL